MKKIICSLISFFPFIDLQLFSADVNPINVTTQASMSPTLKTFYDTNLLENSRENDVFEQFGVKTSIKGNKAEWRKFNTFAPALEPLTEGVIPNGQTFGMTMIEGEVSQHGSYVAISDRLHYEAYDDVIFGASTEMGVSAGDTKMLLCRNALGMGTHVYYAPKSDGTEVLYRKDIDDTCILTPALVKKIATTLKKNKAPKINGSYVMLIHPSQSHDLTSTQEWKEFHKYADPNPIFKGEIGELHGIRFVESTAIRVLKGADLAENSSTLLVNGAINAGAVTSITFDGGTVKANALAGRSILVGDYKFEVVSNTTTVMTVKSVTTSAQIADNTVIYAGEGGKQGTAVYCALALGQGSFGIIDPEGEGMQMIIKSEEQSGGPLNQFSTIGYKFTEGTKILYPERLIRVETGSSLADEDLAN